MLVDPRVNKRKFDREVERLHRNEDQLRQWQCTIKRIEHPNIDLDFELIHTTPVMRFVTSQAIAERLLAEAKKVIPVLRNGGFGVRVGLDDYDLRAPSVAFHDRQTWAPVSQPTEFMAGAFIRNPNVPGGLQNVLCFPHPKTRVPFLCIPGIREYHEHPEHTGDQWLLHRTSMSIFTIVQRIAESCVIHSMPTILDIAGTQMNLGWLAV